MNEISPTFCKLPWTNLNTTPTGSCKLCFNVHDERSIMDWGTGPRTMNWASDSAMGIWNGPYMQDVRRKMLAGERVHDCEACYTAEQSGRTSNRQVVNDDQFYDANGGYGLVARNMPSSLELRISNLCNMACHSCWGGNSSTVLELRRSALSLNETSQLVMPAWLRWAWQGEIGNITRKQQAPGDDYVSAPTSLDNFGAVAPHLRRFYVTGGEPTLDATLPRYLDLLRIADNHGCYVSWSTGCAEWNDELIDKLSFFTNNEIQLSVDAHGLVNEYMRRPAGWDTIDSNIRRYMLDKRVASIRVLTVVGAMNVAVLGDLLVYLRELARDAGRSVIWWPIQLRSPEHQDFRVIGSARRRAIADALESMMSESTDTGPGLQYADGLRGIIDQLRLADDADSAKLRKQLLEYLDYSDKFDAITGIYRRGWRESLPHLELGE